MRDILGNCGLTCLRPLCLPKPATGWMPRFAWFACAKRGQARVPMRMGKRCERRAPFPFGRLITSSHVMNANEHYISQVLLRRFTVAGRLQCYRVQTDKWKRESPQNVFSEFGYNQLLVDGQVDNTLEQAFSKVETHLPKTLEALEVAANKPSTELSSGIYENLCWYCAFLKRISPYAKAAAPADFVVQIDQELKNGRVDTLRDVLNFPETIIQHFQKQYALGHQIIIDSENFLQLVYRIQFRLGYARDYSMFRYNTKWTICNSQIELPLSDMGLVQLQISVHKAVFYVLPIGPKLLLKGQINWGQQTSSSQTLMTGANLTSVEAEYWFDAICLSAVNELVSSRVIPDILAVRARAKTKGITFIKIVDPDTVISAGLKNFTANFGFRFVSTEEYVKFVHSFIQPADK
jgi:hypothetical protein